MGKGEQKSSPLSPYSSTPSLSLLTGTGQCYPKLTCQTLTQHAATATLAQLILQQLVPLLPHCISRRGCRRGRLILLVLVTLIDCALLQLLDQLRYLRMLRLRLSSSSLSYTSGASYRSLLRRSISAYPASRLS